MPDVMGRWILEGGTDAWTVRKINELMDGWTDRWTDE